jgi:hypothetical protein
MIAVAPSLFAQERHSNIIFLKNGSIIKGYVIEIIPDSTTKIRTTDGSLFVFNNDELLKIETANAAEDSLAIVQASDGKDRKEVKKNDNVFSPYCGVALPVGSFASASGGDAVAGLNIGLRVWSVKPIGPFLDLGYSSNSMDSYSSIHWRSILLLGGPKMTFGGEEDHQYTLAPLIGLLISTLSDGSTSYSGSAFTYGLLGQIHFYKHVVIAGRYVYAEPEYKVGNYSVEQSTNLISITLGIVF